jgi:RNA polymerase sigma factor (sigma-70 family)
MKQKQKKTSILNKYFKEVRGYPVLSKEEEVGLSLLIREEVENIKATLLSIPEVWDFLLGKYLFLKGEGKAVSKLSNSYGTTLSIAKDLSEQIEDAMLYLRHVREEEDATEKIMSLFLQADISQSLYFEAAKWLETRFKGEEYVDTLEEIEESKRKFFKYRNKFLCSNLRLVVSFALQYKHLGVQLEDLIQEGNEALVKAIEKFDPGREFKFSTYASWWIRQAFIRIFRNQGRDVRLPSHIHEMATKIQKNISELDNENSMDKISERCGIKVETIKRIGEAYVDPISLETVLSKSRNRHDAKTLKEFLVAKCEDPVEVVSRKETEKKIQNLISSLKEPHKSVILYRFGFVDNNPRTLEGASKIFGIPKDKVKKVESEALEMLKKKMLGEKKGGHVSLPTVGVIGGGFVGGSICEGFKHYTDVKLFDLNGKRSVNSYEETINQDIIFVCLPTPMKKDGNVDLSILIEAMEKLSANLEGTEIAKPVIIKSTIPPGTCASLQKRLNNLFVVFSPEFLTERTASLDFIQQKRIILGVGSVENTSQIAEVKDLFKGRFPEIPIKVLHWDEASLIKYFTNVFFCTKVSVFNEFAQISKALGFNPDKIAGEVLNDGRIGRSHCFVPGHDGKKGYGGSCFCKDINGYMKFVKNIGVEPTMAEASWEQNLRIRPGRDWEELKGRAVSDD